MAIPICTQGQVACSIPVCIWGLPYASRDFVNANMHIGNGITATSPIPVCIQWLAWSPYADGHQQLAIPICIRWFARSLYAYGDSPVTNPSANGLCLHMGIWSPDPHMQNFAYGDLFWSPFKHKDILLKSPNNLHMAIPVRKTFWSPYGDQNGD